MPWWAWAIIAASVVLAITGFTSRARPHIKPTPQAVHDLAPIPTATPGLRARFFADPTKQIGKQLPARKYWEWKLETKPWYVIGSWRELRKARAATATKIVAHIAKDIRGGTLSASINTDAVFAEFFAPIVRASQQSFTSVFLLSWGAFLAGLVLIGSGIYIAITSPPGTNSTVVGSVFGGAGTIGALGSVYAMAKQGIREATIDHARLRMVLTAFATQLGQLRALAERASEADAKPRTVDEETQKLNAIKELNAAIAASMTGALELVPSPQAPNGAAKQNDQS
jgi:hypothetical protein